MTKDIYETMQDIGRRAKLAAQELATASAKSKQDALTFAADSCWARRDEIVIANAKDLAFAREKGLSAAMLDRLMLDQDRIFSMCEGLRAVASQEDPVGEIMEQWSRPSGLNIRRVRTPLGVIGVIYESRPNVTADAGALCLKSGNSVILRGGSESFHSSALIHSCLQDGLAKAGLNRDIIQRVPTRDREAVREMLTMIEYIDVIVPRGGKGLVGLVQREARVPVFAHLEGIVHIYVDKAADPQKTIDVVLNAKTRRTGICGSAECLLVHQDALELGQIIVDRLVDAGVEMRVGDRLSGSQAATKDDWGHEFLDMKMAAKVVNNIDEAIAHINQFSSSHTDAIMTEDDQAAAQFFRELDSAILMQNASTQFADGAEFGMGAEIGIATGKMHARGPIGAKQLTSFKYLVLGDGTTRP